MKTVDYFRQVKRRLGIESDYALAKHLNLQSSAISKIMAGKHTMGDETALKVAETLGLPPALVLADVHAEREKNPAVAAVWRSMVEKFSMGFNTLISGATPRGCSLSTC